jgi:hypothetical protein
MRPSDVDALAHKFDVPRIGPRCDTQSKGKGCELGLWMEPLWMEPLWTFG